MPAARATGAVCRGLCGFLVLAALMLGRPLARANGPLGPEGAPIRTSDYAVDVTRGPVLSATRVTGLAGAFSAIAEGVEGGLSNPAAVAVRFPASVDFWDYWLAFSFTYPIQNGDFFNNNQFLEQHGELGSRSFYFFNPGAYLQLYRFGLGVDMEIQQLNVGAQSSSAPQKNPLQIFVVTTHLQVGSRLFDGQLVIGGGLEVLRLVASGGPSSQRTNIIQGPQVPVFEGQAKIFADYGFGGELGVLWRPNWKAWRLGGGLYSVARTNPGSAQDHVAFGYYLPRFAERPWQGSVSFAYQFGKRPFNPRFTYVDEAAQTPLAAIEHRRREARRAHEARLSYLRREGGAAASLRIDEENQVFAEQRELFDAEEAAVRKDTWRALRERVRTGWSRRYLLLTTEISFTGRVPNAVGVESFLVQVVQRSGERVSVGPRLGLESEILPAWIKARIGSYLEPARFRESSPRLHGTFGFDVRLVHWDVFKIWPEDYLWQISAAYDVARDYHAFSTSIGGFY